MPEDERVMGVAEMVEDAYLDELADALEASQPACGFSYYCCIAQTPAVTTIDGGARLGPIPACQRCADLCAWLDR